MLHRQAQTLFRGFLVRFKKLKLVRSGLNHGQYFLPGSALAGSGAITPAPFKEETVVVTILEIIAAIMLIWLAWMIMRK
jgi:hypothetical protein